MKTVRSIVYLNFNFSRISSRAETAKGMGKKLQRERHNQDVGVVYAQAASPEWQGECNFSGEGGKRLPARPSGTRNRKSRFNYLTESQPSCYQALCLPGFVQSTPLLHCMVKRFYRFVHSCIATGTVHTALYTIIHRVTRSAGSPLGNSPRSAPVKIVDSTLRTAPRRDVNGSILSVLRPRHDREVHRFLRVHGQDFSSYGVRTLYRASRCLSGHGKKRSTVEPRLSKWGPALVSIKAAL